MCATRVSSRYMMVLCIACQSTVAVFGFLAWKTYSPGILRPACSSMVLTVTDTDIMSDGDTADPEPSTGILSGHSTAHASCPGADNVVFSNGAAVKRTTDL